MELRGVKILLVPDKEQRHKLYKFACYADKMYNIALQWNIDYYNDCGKFYASYDMIRRLPKFKKENEEFSAIADFVLRSAIMNLRTALDRVSNRTSRFPRFKKVGRKLSFGVSRNALGVCQSYVYIPKVGTVKCKHCHWLTRNKTSRELYSMMYYNPHVRFDGKYWFLTFGVEVDIEPDEVTEEVIGVDLGILHTAYMSTGDVKDSINKSRQVKLLERRKRLLHRRISRAYDLNKSGNKFVKTNNIRRRERKLRLVYRKLKNIRDSYLQQIVNWIIARHPKRVVIEDLRVLAMLRNKYLSRAVQEQSFFRFRKLLIEKALNTLVTQVCVVKWNFPSSKICSSCGAIKKDLKLSDRVYNCTRCGLVIDRDLNAAINLRNCSDYTVAVN